MDPGECERLMGLSRPAGSAALWLIFRTSSSFSRIASPKWGLSPSPPSLHASLCRVSSLPLSHLTIALPPPPPSSLLHLFPLKVFFIGCVYTGVCLHTVHGEPPLFIVPRSIRPSFILTPCWPSPAVSFLPFLHSSFSAASYLLFMVCASADLIAEAGHRFFLEMLLICTFFHFLF